MELMVNGERYVAAAERLTVAQLLADRGVESAAMVAVQKNGNFVDQAEYDREELTAGDAVEFLYFMGGGGR